MEYKLVMNQMGTRNLKLVVKIKDLNQNIVVYDSTQINSKVQ